MREAQHKWLQRARKPAEIKLCPDQREGALRNLGWIAEVSVVPPPLAAPLAAGESRGAAGHTECPGFLRFDALALLARKAPVADKQRSKFAGAIALREKAGDGPDLSRIFGLAFVGRHAP